GKTIRPRRRSLDASRLGRHLKIAVRRKLNEVRAARSLTRNPPAESQMRLLPEELRHAARRREVQRNCRMTDHLQASRFSLEPDALGAFRDHAPVVIPLAKRYRILSLGHALMHQALELRIRRHLKLGLSTP